MREIHVEISVSLHMQGHMHMFFPINDTILHRES